MHLSVNVAGSRINITNLPVQHVLVNDNSTLIWSAEQFPTPLFAKKVKVSE